jgi:hypothetical protein
MTLSAPRLGAESSSSGKRNRTEVPYAKLVVTAASVSAGTAT